MSSGRGGMFPEQLLYGDDGQQLPRAAEQVPGGAAQVEERAFQTGGRSDAHHTPAD